MIDPQQVVERALAARTVDESLVIVTDASEASLRWANNSMTTNGVSLSRTWTVISIVRGAAGISSARPRSTGSLPGTYRSESRRRAAVGHDRRSEPC